MEPNGCSNVMEAVFVYLIHEFDSHQNTARHGIRMSHVYIFLKDLYPIAHQKGIRGLN